MYQNLLPGQPIHIRVAGDHVLVTFEHIPWQLRCDDVAGAIHAFSDNDWPYFKNLWWSRHDHLNQPSKKLALLIPHLSSDEFYSANRIISLGSFLGFYGSWDLAEMEHDFQRLALLPTLNAWPNENAQKVNVNDGASTKAWLGSQWLPAIEHLSVGTTNPMPFMGVNSAPYMERASV